MRLFVGVRANDVCEVMIVRTNHALPPDFRVERRRRLCQLPDSLHRHSLSVLMYPSPELHLRGLSGGLRHHDR
jgi:hypothetical protein